MDKRRLIQSQPIIREIYKKPPLISYRKGKSLRDWSISIGGGGVGRSIWEISGSKISDPPFPLGSKLTVPPLIEGLKLHDPPPHKKIWFNTLLFACTCMNIS